MSEVVSIKLKPSDQICRLSGKMAAGQLLINMSYVVLFDFITMRRKRISIFYQGSRLSAMVCRTTRSSLLLLWWTWWMQFCNTIFNKFNFRFSPMCYFILYTFHFLKFMFTMHRILCFFSLVLIINYMIIHSKFFTTILPIDLSFVFFS